MIDRLNVPYEGPTLRRKLFDVEIVKIDFGVKKS